MPAQRDGLAELAEIDRVFGALAHASRRQILLLLRARGDRVKAGDIARRFSCSWPTTSRHLRVLEEAGLVRTVQEGRERFYELRADRLRRVVGEWVGHFGSGAGGARSSSR